MKLFIIGALIAIISAFKVEREHQLLGFECSTDKMCGGRKKCDIGLFSSKCVPN